MTTTTIAMPVMKSPSQTGLVIDLDELDVMFGNVSHTLSTSEMLLALVKQDMNDREKHKNCADDTKPKFKGFKQILKHSMQIAPRYSAYVNDSGDERYTTQIQLLLDRTSDAITSFYGHIRFQRPITTGVVSLNAGSQCPLSKVVAQNGMAGCRINDDGEEASHKSGIGEISVSKTDDGGIDFEWTIPILARYTCMYEAGFCTLEISDLSKEDIWLNPVWIENTCTCLCFELSMTNGVMPFFLLWKKGERYVFMVNGTAHTWEQMLPREQKKFIELEPGLNKRQ